MIVQASAVIAVLLCLFPIPSVAMEPMTLREPCSFAWDYDPHPNLGSFSVFLRAEGDAYPTLPAKIIPAIERMTVSFPCEKIRFFGTVVYYLFIRAEGITQEVSPRSNEIAVRVVAPQVTPPPGPPVVPQPPPTIPAPNPPPSYLPPAPPPLMVVIPTSRPPVVPQQPSGGSPWISDSCQWQGNCAR